MEQSHSWKANSHWASQEIPWLLWNPKVHYSVHKSLPLVPTLSWKNQSTPSHLISLRSIVILSSHICLGLPFRFSNQNTVYIPHISYACYMTIHFIVLGLITLAIFMRRTSYEVPHYVVFSSFPQLTPPEIQIFSSAPCSQTYLNHAPPLVWETKFHIHTKQQVKLWFCTF